MFNRPPPDDSPRDWVFTFGHGQPHFPGYVRIHGTFHSARTEMIRRYELRWSMQYTSEDAADAIVKWNLPEVKEAT